MAEQQQEAMQQPQEVTIQQRGEVSPAASYQPMTLTEKAKYAAVAGVPSLLLLELLHARGPGFAIAGLVGYGAWHFSDRIRDMLPERSSQQKQKSSQPVSKQVQSALYWLGTGQAMPAAPEEQQNQDEEGSIETTLNEAPTEDDGLFTLELGDDTNGVARLTIEQIVRNCEPNSYKIFIGRSMTKPGNKAILINFYNQHFRFIGASQRGKSSMVAAFLDIITRTHDPKHVRLALLDKEDRTGRLFAHLPHVATIRRDGQRVKLHARNVDQVLDYLIATVEIMEYRYTLSVSEIEALPILLVYIEEFLRLKDELRVRIAQAEVKGKKEAAKALSDFETFAYCIKALAQQGLKVRVQMLLCAQVEYADDSFKEAMASVQCGFSFSLEPGAAGAAGFMNRALIRRNAAEKKVGQAVVETPDCNDLVLAPDFNLKQRLLEFERAHPDIHRVHHSPDEDDSEHEPRENGAVNVNAVNMVNEPVKPVNTSVNGGEYSPRPVNNSPVSPTYTQAEEVQVLLAYAEMQKSGKTVTRTGIRDYLVWDNKQYARIVKPVCDKHNIG